VPSPSAQPGTTDRRAAARLALRFAVVAAYTFWIGGFTFYSSVVIPVNQGVLGSRVKAGFITRQVTHCLNLSGALALPILLWNVLSIRRLGRNRLSIGLGLWLLMAAAQVALYVLHPKLDRLLDLQARDVLEPSAFRALHRLYLWIATVQWAVALVYLAWALAAWRRQDSQS
jgi:hypothetical protein